MAWFDLRICGGIALCSIFRCINQYCWFRGCWSWE